MSSTNPNPTGKALKNSCLSSEDVEYFVQASRFNPKEEESTILHYQTHLQHCSECEKKVVQFQQAVQANLNQATSYAINPSFEQKIPQPIPKNTLVKEGDIVAGCKLLKRIGGGGMGDVYKALKLSLNKIVAIKILKSMASNEEQKKRFQREAIMLAQIEHPNITQVYDFYSVEGIQDCYLIMQYVEGEDLERYITRKGRLPLIQAIPFFNQLLEGVGHLHKRNIIHRDIKPSNILVDPDNKVKIADFGLAKSATSFQEENITVAGLILGTPQYMSPEACKGNPQTKQSDIYSLGALFFYILTLRPPFIANSTIEILSQHLYKEIPSITEMIPEIPISFEAILKKMMAKSPQERYRNIDELQNDLRAFANAKSTPSSDILWNPSYYPNSAISNYPNPPETTMLHVQQNSPPFSEKEPSTDSYSIPLFNKMEETGTRVPPPFVTPPESSHLFRAKNFGTCFICKQSKMLSLLFYCKHCQQRACIEHRLGETCEQCTQKELQLENIQKLITQKIGEKLVVAPLEEGKLSFLILANLFSFLNERNTNSSILVSNEQGKRGIFFRENRVSTTTFGTHRLVKLGSLLLQNSRLSEQKLNEALELQKKQQQKKLGEILIENKFISEHSLKEGLLEQIRKDIFELTQWKQAHYKFRYEESSAESSENGSDLESHIEVHNMKKFRSSLISIFQHLSFITAPGILTIKSSRGNVSFFASKEKIAIVNFEPRYGFKIREEFIKERLLDELQFQKIPMIADCLLGNYLVQKGLVQRFEVQRLLQKYLAQEIISYLSTPDFEFNFIEGDLSQKELDKLSPSELGLDIKNFIYSLFEKANTIPPLLGMDILFEMIKDKDSSQEIVDILRQKIRQSLPIKTFLSQFSSFETALLSLALLKSNLIGYFRSLQECATLLIMNNYEQEAGKLIDSALEVI